MEKIKIRLDSIYALFAIISLIYVNYYQAVLYYKHATQYSSLLDKTYEYIAIPSFYFFVTAFITFVIFDIFKINIARTLSKIILLIMCFVLILYIALVILNIIRVIAIPTVGFASIYSIIFSVLGCFLALASHKN
ncbi:MAG TPA: hypothetical protein DEG06_04385 [Lachnospiraceae bacterium]|jgi:hypothetical protein|nr:hypothetical protein [Lachnospiraceae bacterium]